MPIPSPGNETQGQFMERCIRFVMDEGTPREQAVAICINQWEQGKSGQYWIKFEKSRRSLEKWTVRQIREALKQSVVPITEATTLSDMQSRDVDIRPIKDAFIRIYQRVGREFANAIYKSLKQKKDEVLFTSWDAHMETFALTQAGERIVNIADTTLKRVRRVINEGIQSELGIRKIAQNIAASDGISLRRALVIARTEIVSASNEGAVLGANSTGLDYKKEWISAIDSRTRSFDKGDMFDHIVMDGTTVEKGEPFITPSTNGSEPLDYPGDPKGSAGNVINCRCTVAFIPYE